MRELKFRAWVNDHWVDWIPTCETLGDYNASVIDTDGYTFEEDNPFIVEQYTGLTDKNGKEIYEGDIVKQLMYVLEDKEHITTWVVRWNKEDCCFELHYLGGSRFGDSMMSDEEEYKVIGNIHETPELLGGEE